jgi:hypothetical protein
MIVAMNDFDFFVGSWNVVNRRLRALFAGSDDWEVFPATSTGQSLFTGGGNLDEIVFSTKGTRGLTLRLYDTERKEWSLYWSNSQTGRLYPPVVGTFRDGRGDFYGDDVVDGKPIKAHFIWTGTTTDTPRWEQEFSADDGNTWETNWIMEFSRA